jgi:hypothetical protein
MSWTTPELTEVKMDAEIGSYQPDDFEGNEPVATPAAAPSAE